MATPTTFDTDTELSSVNSILGAIGQSPVTTLYTNKGEVKSVSITAPAQVDLDPGIADGDVYSVQTSSSSNATGLQIRITIITANPLSYKYDVIATGRNYSKNTVVSFNLAELSNWSATVTSLVESTIFVNPEVSFIKQLLDEASTDVQNEGWVFNRELGFPLTPDGNDEIVVPSNMLRIDISDDDVDRSTNVVVRGGKLYDKVKHSNKFTKKISADIVWKIDFSDLPSPFRRYITYRAAVRAATQQVNNPQLAQMLAQQEAYSRAICIEYECEQGDYSMFGTPVNTQYRPYQPYKMLSRLA